MNPDTDDSFLTFNNVLPEADSVFPNAEYVLPESGDAFPDSGDVYPECDSVHSEGGSVNPESDEASLAKTEDHLKWVESRLLNERISILPALCLPFPTLVAVGQSGHLRDQ